MEPITSLCQTHSPASHNEVSCEIVIGGQRNNYSYFVVTTVSLSCQANQPLVALSLIHSQTVSNFYKHIEWPLATTSAVTFQTMFSESKHSPGCFTQKVPPQAKESGRLEGIFRVTVRAILTDFVYLRPHDKYMHSMIDPTSIYFQQDSFSSSDPSVKTANGERLWDTKKKRIILLAVNSLKSRPKWISILWAEYICQKGRKMHALIVKEYWTQCLSCFRCIELVFPTLSWQNAKSKMVKKVNCHGGERTVFLQFSILVAKLSLKQVRKEKSNIHYLFTVYHPSTIRTSGGIPWKIVIQRYAEVFLLNFHIRGWQEIFRVH